MFRKWKSYIKKEIKGKREREYFDVKLIEFDRKVEENKNKM